MKYLLVTVFVVAVLWFWSHRRRIGKQQSAKSTTPSAEKTALTEIVACDVCQVHLPKTDALIGAEGVYCSEAHRRQADR